MASERSLPVGGHFALIVCGFVCGLVSPPATLGLPDDKRVNNAAIRVERPEHTTPTSALDSNPVVAEPVAPGIPPGHILIEGDIIVPDDFHTRTAVATNTWVGGIVPYEFHPAVSAEQQRRMLNAMEEWEFFTRVDFVPRTTEYDRIYIQPSNGNSSFVGRQVGPQVFNIKNWEEKYIIVHELGHALGLWHEQSRYDRDNYISINVQNIQPGEEDNFKTQSYGFYFGPYDFDSVMHYGKCDFSIACPIGSRCDCPPGTETITVLPPYAQWQDRIGQRDHLSDGDIESIAILYGYEDYSLDWVQRFPANAPGPRVGHAMAYDERRSRTVMYGGTLFSGYYGDLWEWDGSNWSLRWNDGDSFGPSPRYGHAAAYVGGNPGKILFVGGNAAIGDGGVWMWDGASWSLPNTGPFPLEDWFIVGSHEWGALASTSGSVRYVAFGPQTCGVCENTYTRMSDRTFADATAGPWYPHGCNTIGTFPPARFNVALAEISHAFGQGFVLFGGLLICEQSGYTNETWISGNTPNDGWQLVNPPISPPAMIGHAMAYDSDRRCTVLLGSGQTWEWSGSEWRPVYTQHTPCSSWSLIVYDVARKKTVAFGGCYDNKTWELEKLPPAFTITQQPASRTTCEGQSVTFTVLTANTGGVSGARRSRWRKNGVTIPGENYASSSVHQFTIPRVAFGDAGTYDVVITDARGSIVSSPATLTVLPALRVAQHPANQTVCAGRPASFFVNAIGNGALSYLWRRNGVNLIEGGRISGSQTSTLTINPVQAGDDGSYDVVVTDSACAVTSRGALLRSNLACVASANQVPLGANYGIGTAFDAFRQKFVLFGFFSNGLTHLWQGDGLAWNIHREANQPNPTPGFAMTYDSMRRVTVLYGYNGLFGTSSQTQTWEWDGASWRLAAIGGPEARTNAGMTFDSVRNVVVLFGGDDGSYAGTGSGLLGDTWEWDGAQWTCRSTSGPSPRGRHPMAFDSARGVSVLFGGATDRVSALSGETWEWNGTSWSLRSSTGPSPRSLHAAAFDPIREKTVLFGGYTGGSTYDGETWEWDGLQWNLVSSTGPQPRGQAAMVFDDVQGECVLFGGFAPTSQTTGTLPTEIWSWDGSDWAIRNPGAPPENSFSAVTFDSFRNRIVSFGGNTFNVVHGETWEWDGLSWIRRDVSGPPPRAPAAGAFDARRNVSVLFGGWQPAGYYGDTWEWDGVAWAQRATTGPSPRGFTTLGYDRAREVVTLFGGLGSSGFLGDTWEWDGVSWVLRSNTGPSPRYYHAMAYDSLRQVFVIFGGATASGYSGETWEWNGTQWDLRSTTGPAPRIYHAMAYDEARNSVLMIGGRDAGVLADAWEWDGALWTKVFEGTPASRFYHSLVYDSARQEFLLHGGAVGQVTTNLLERTWRWRTIPSQGDGNRDALVNALDVQGFVTAMLEPESEDVAACSYDLDEDGLITFIDLQLFVTALLEP